MLPVMRYSYFCLFLLCISDASVYAVASLPDISAIPFVSRLRDQDWSFIIRPCVIVASTGKIIGWKIVVTLANHPISITVCVCIAYLGHLGYRWWYEKPQINGIAQKVDELDAHAKKKFDELIKQIVVLNERIDKADTNSSNLIGQLDENVIVLGEKQRQGFNSIEKKIDLVGNNVELFRNQLLSINNRMMADFEQDREYMKKMGQYISAEFEKQQKMLDSISSSMKKNRDENKINFEDTQNTLHFIVDKLTNFDNKCEQFLMMSLFHSEQTQKSINCISEEKIFQNYYLKKLDLLMKKVQMQCDYFQECMAYRRSTILKNPVEKKKNNKTKIDIKNVDLFNPSYMKCLPAPV